ncbi:FAD-dependent monooxygenase [Streptomyces sp. NPDC006872]|uniref:FAD-dependent monooxygenase n=1 Tax=Streptomyces sp. NPDC006872 TaxID=3155720 RepID=UPI0033FAA5C4
MYFDYVTHPVTTPDLTGGWDPVRRRTVIAGGGPTGLALALGLARYGVPSVVLESDRTVCAGSRAACLSRRTLEIMDQLGAVDTYLAKGLAWNGGVSYYGDTEVLRFAMPHDENQKFPPMINLQQCYAEQYLLDAIDRYGDGLVEIRWGSRVEALRQDPDGVELEVRTDDGDTYTMAADWLVGCDGARSTVREQLGLRLTGTAYEGRYVIVDVELKTDRPALRYAWFDPPSNPGSTLLMHCQPDDIWRLDYQLLPGEDPEEAVRPENVMPRVRSHLRMIGEPDDVEPVWISLYKANALTLDSYRHGRVLFAGDAAHLVPIFGVRGMNSAIDDTHNLAWKLAFVAAGRSPVELLDTYSVERVHAARENIRYASKSTEFMAPPSFAFDTMRTAVLGLAVEGHTWASSLINPRQTQPISYEDCGFTGPADPSVGGPGPAAGEVLPECPLTLTGGKAGHLTDLLGPRITVLAFTADGELAPDLRAELDALSTGPVPLATAVVSAAPTRTAAHDHTGRMFPLYGAQPGTVYLIRPDGHVYARRQHPRPGEIRAWVDAMTAGRGLGRDAR